MKCILSLIILFTSFALEAEAQLKLEWDAYEKAYKTQLAKADFNLYPAAKQADFTTLEKTLGLKLPAEFKELYMIGNGQDAQSSFGVFPDGFQLLTAQQIGTTYTELKAQVGKHDFGGMATALGVPFNQNGVKDEFRWHAKWIPFASDGHQNYLCLDLDPAKGGKVGQVISVYFDDIAVRRADSLSSLFKALAGSISQGDIIAEDGVLLDYGVYENEEDFYTEEEEDAFWLHVYYLLNVCCIGLGLIAMGFVINFKEEHQVIADEVGLYAFEKMVKLQMRLAIVSGIILIACMLLGIYCYIVDLMGLIEWIIIGLVMRGFGKIVNHVELGAKSLSVTCSTSSMPYRELCVRWERVAMPKFRG